MTQIQASRQSPARNTALAAGVVAFIGVSAGFAAEGEIKPRLSLVPPEPASHYLKYGPFEFMPHLAGGVVYDDNIRISGAARQKDVVWTIAPGVLVGAGDYQGSGGNFVSLDYSAGFVLFTDNSGNNSLDHDLDLQAQRKFSKLTLQAGQAYRAASGGVVEVANRVDRDVYLTTFKVSYDWSDKTSLEMNLAQNVTVYAQALFLGFNEWTDANWVNYKFSDKLTFSAGATFGWRDVRGSLNEMFQQALLRTLYQISEKVDLEASIGGEFRQFQGGKSAGPSLVFSVGGDYKPVDRMLISLEAFRRNQNSVASNNQNYTTTGFRTGVRQQFGEKFTAGLGGGFENAKYEATAIGAGTARKDEYWFIEPSLDCTVTARWVIGVFYHHRENTSSQAGSGFANNQAGLRSTFRF